MGLRTTDSALLCFSLVTSSWVFCVDNTFKTQMFEPRVTLRESACSRSCVQEGGRATLCRAPRQYRSSIRIQCIMSCMPHHGAHAPHSVGSPQLGHRANSRGQYHHAHGSSKCELARTVHSVEHFTAKLIVYAEPYRRKMMSCNKALDGNHQGGIRDT